MWYTEGPQTNPAANTVLADTGPIGPGTYLFDVVVSAGAAVDVAFQHRNAANNATIKQHEFYLAAKDKAQFVFEVPLASGERVRIITLTAVTAGKVSGSIDKKE